MVTGASRGIGKAIAVHAGHDLWSRDPGAYLAVLLPFLERIGQA
jgi:hypothetical protein